MLVPVSGMHKWGLNCWFMKSNILASQHLAALLSAFFKKSFHALGMHRENLSALSQMSRVPSTCPHRCVGKDCRHLSAEVRSQWPLQLSETFAGLYWSYLFRWTMTSVKWWRFWLRQHLREQGFNRGRGSPIKCLVGFTLNRYTKFSQFRHLPMQTLNQKTHKKMFHLQWLRFTLNF